MTDPSAQINGSSYRQADADIDFPNQEDTRGVRLQLDYQKAELVLEEHKAAHTIVVFGSARIMDPEAARQALDASAAALATNRNDPELRAKLVFAQQAFAKSRYYDVARAFGRLVSTAGSRTRSGRLMIMTGGGPGIMEAANRGAHDVGAPSIGLNISLPKEQRPNRYVTPDLCFRFHYFAIRKLHFLMRARALVAFPGGYGTMDELFEVLTLAQTNKIQPIPIILVGEHHWRRALDPDYLVQEGLIDRQDRSLFWFAETAGEIWDGILAWYEAAGQPLLAEGAECCAAMGA